MREIPNDIPGHAMLHISCREMPQDILRSRLHLLPLQSVGEDLVLALPSQTPGINCTLITLWSLLQHCRRMLKSLLQQKVDIRVVCLVDEPITDLRLEPDALLLSSKLGIPLEIKVRRKTGKNRTPACSLSLPPDEAASE